MIAAPAVSVLMPAYDAADYVVAAVESVLGQSRADLELIVVDDGSTDATPRLLAGLSDPRLVVLTEPRNRGYVPALNRAIGVARGHYLARQDADDLSLPDRLRAQVERMERDPGLVLLGTGYRTIDAAGTVLATHRLPGDDAAIRWHMLFRNAFVHSSIMIRRSALEDPTLRYDASYAPAEDYRLWSQLLLRGRAANLGEPLVAHRRHEGQISRREGEVQRGNARRVSRENLSRLAVELDDHEIDELRRRALGGAPPATAAEMSALARARDVVRALAAAGDRRTAAYARHAWVETVLGELPVRRLRAAWRSGLLPALLSASPAAALSTLVHRFRRRLTERIRPQTAAAGAARAHHPGAGR